MFRKANAVSFVVSIDIDKPNFTPDLMPRDRRHVMQMSVEANTQGEGFRFTGLRIAAEDAPKELAGLIGHVMQILATTLEDIEKGGKHADRIEYRRYVDGDYVEVSEAEYKAHSRKPMKFDA